MTWRPIETAPKTGSFLACWRSKKMRRRLDILEWVESNGALWCGHTCINELEVSFSHWMPLPDLPEGATTAELTSAE